MLTAAVSAGRRKASVDAPTFSDAIDVRIVPGPCLRDDGAGPVRAVGHELVGELRRRANNRISVLLLGSAART